MKYLVMILFLIGLIETIFAFEPEEPVHLEIIFVEPKQVYDAGDSIKITIRAVNHFFPGNVTVGLMDNTTKMIINEITVPKESETAIAKIDIPVTLSTGTYEIFAKSIIRNQEYHDQKIIQVYNSKSESNDNFIEESVQLARDKVIMAEESHGDGSGTSIFGFIANDFDNSEYVLITVIIAVIIGSGLCIGLILYWRNKK
jgi:hypothetical protein